MVTILASSWMHHHFLAIFSLGITLWFIFSLYTAFKIAPMMRPENELFGFVIPMNAEENFILQSGRQKYPITVSVFFRFLKCVIFHKGSTINGCSTCNQDYWLICGRCLQPKSTECGDDYVPGGFNATNNR